MASDDCRKDDLQEDNRTDSGIELCRSLCKSEEQPREPSTDFGEPRDKFTTAGEDRLDSAYGSSSITVESLTEIVGDCTLSTVQEDQAQISELSEQEENLLTTITEDGDTQKTEVKQIGLDFPMKHTDKAHAVRRRQQQAGSSNVEGF